MVAMQQSSPAPKIEAAPGKSVTMHAPAFSPDELPKFMTAQVVPLGGGAFRLQPRPLNAWVSFSRRDLDRLGITISQTTLRRLAVAKFIEVRQISPSRHELSLQSWFAHCDRVQNDPEFWTRKDAAGKSNLKKYVEVTCDV
jgi:hypothetical protein